MSDGSSSRPGGQPSTTQPMAGPWLSPKVVTVNSTPKLLPDIRRARQMPCLRCGCEGFPVLHEFLFRQQKHAAAARVELKPQEGYFRKTRLQCLLAHAHFN